MAVSPLDITIRPIDDFSTLAPIWRDLEGRADASFFQSWAWTGCLAEERFPAPWLLMARRSDKVVALGLFNRGPPGRLGGRPFLLGESGRPDLDTIFVEHNGLLLDRGEDGALAANCWAALAGQRDFRKMKWVVSGVTRSVQAGLPADRRLRVTASRPAPYFDFASAAPVIDQLSANSRQQLRRSLRAWEDIGPLTLERASRYDAADMWLDALRDLHQLYWTGRGKPGAFAAPFFGRFHHALIGRAAPGQSVDLIHVQAGDRTVGYLYNLVHDGWVAAYQSGFDFGPDADRLRPGLVCHLLAIEHYRRAGMRRYDFLGGEARYKRSFANGETELLWLEARTKIPLAFRSRPCFS